MLPETVFYFLLGIPDCNGLSVLQCNAFSHSLRYIHQCTSFTRYIRHCGQVYMKKAPSLPSKLFQCLVASHLHVENITSYGSLICETISRPPFFYNYALYKCLLTPVCHKCDGITFVIVLCTVMLHSIKRSLVKNGAAVSKSIHRGDEL